MFDDNCCRGLGGGRLGRPDGPSGGLVLHLDPVRHTATRVAVYGHHPVRNVAFLGSMQALDGGNTLVGWGSLPYFSEFSRSGRLLLDAVWPGKDQSYRALFSDTWVGTPYYPPAGAARRTGHATTVYASWNGATEVRSWEVLALGGRGSPATVGRHARTGFETVIRLPRGSYRRLEVRALDAAGHTLGTSRTFTPR